MTTPKHSQRRSQARRKPPAPTGFRSPIRISLDHEALAALDKRAIAAQVGIGVVAGWLASWLVGGSGLLRYVLTGLVGALVGGALLEQLGSIWAFEVKLRTVLLRRRLGQWWSFCWHAS